MRKTLKVLFVLLAILVATCISHTSLAYFASSVSSANTQLDTTVQVGTWIHTWSPYVLYHRGDIVSWHGALYKAKRTSMSKMPAASGSTNFWQIML